MGSLDLRRNYADRRRGTIGNTYTAEQFCQIMMRVLPTWAAAAWNPRATTPSQTLWRFLLVKVLTLLSHHSLLRAASIREITLPAVFLYHPASTSEVNPDSQPVVMVIAARNSKTSKDARLQHELRGATPGSGAVRHRRDRPVAALHPRPDRLVLRHRLPSAA
ncbi:unnamed protein product [Closterium sp. NIES-65]|nr:unnamed protein product [Closterium sp. NIES-65]